VNTASESTDPSVRKNESIRLFLRGSPRSFASGRRRPADPPRGALSDKAGLKKSHRGDAAIHQRGENGRARGIARERRNLEICCSRTIPS
jgi:hypothetical protein